MSSNIERASANPDISWGKVAMVLAGVAVFQFLAHWAISVDANSIVSEVFVVGPLCVIFVGLLLRTGTGRLILLGVVPIGAAGYWAWRRTGSDPTLLYPLPQICLNLFMLWLFGRTLRSGQEALITRVARHVHKDMSVELAAYTRRVTQAWCVFFVAMIIVSLLLFFLVSLDAWSTFTNLFGLPLVAGMFVAEYAWRRLRHPEFMTGSLLSGIRAFRDVHQQSPATSVLDR